MDIIGFLAQCDVARYALLFVLLAHLGAVLVARHAT
jgi:hypothetical protein